MRVELPYGRAPLRLELRDREVTILRARQLPAPRASAELLEEALRDAVMPRVSDGARVTIIVSDATRVEPRVELLSALLRRLPDAARITLAIATGTHGPAPAAFVAALVEASGLGARGSAIVNHDGHRDDQLVHLGTTARGTPVLVHRCVLDADLVIATGCIRPHYFAGFGAGAKAVFPGLGQAAAIRTNHAWKTHPCARAGILDGNPCREDIEEAVALVPTPILLVNGVCGPARAARPSESTARDAGPARDHEVHAFVVGSLDASAAKPFRRGCDLARPWFTVSASPAPLVIASDAFPVTATLYQAAKLAAAAAPLVAANGTLVLAAECFEGIGPLEVVNEAIFRIGVLPRLAPGVSLQLLSSLPPDLVEQSLLEPCDLDRVLRTRCPVVVLPNASQLIIEAT